MNRYFTLAILGLALAGCATAGNQQVREATQESVSQQITKGKTTKDDVRSHMGDPTTVSFTDSGNEIWNYSFVKATPKAVNFVPVVGSLVRGVDTETKQLVVIFDKKGVVMNYSLSNSKGEVNTGLVQ